jgi:hypothetical protein
MGHKLSSYFTNISTMGAFSIFRIQLPGNTPLQISAVTAHIKIVMATIGINLFREIEPTCSCTYSENLLPRTSCRVEKETLEL